MRIIVLEDEPAEQLLLMNALRSIDSAPKVVGTAEQFSIAMRREIFDVVVLDWTLPDASGISVVKQLRQSGNQVPVLFLTVRDSEEDIIEALNAGANDYLVKPFRKDELVARLGALVRRSSAPEFNSREFQYRHYHFNLDKQTVTCRGSLIELTRKEFRLALLLFRNIGRPLSRARLRDEVWGANTDVPSNIMDTHASRVRSKLSLRPDNGFYLAPIYSYGYRLEDVTSEESSLR